MKKIFTFLMCIGISSVIFAQSPFVTSPDSDPTTGDEIGFQGEGMSENRKYVAGSDIYTSLPAIWNTETQAITRIIKEVESPEGAMNMTGYFHNVSCMGTAVGALQHPVTTISYPIMAKASGNGEYTELYHTAADAGSEAYAISADDGTIIGFYFDADWTTHACVWTYNGTVREDLPVPTAEQMGIELDYVSARWISADGFTVLGYGQDAATGEWVALAWKKVGETWTPVCFSNDYFQVMRYDENTGEVILPENPKPYYGFEPTGLSQDGNWVALSLTPLYDANDWNAEILVTAGRYNLTTGELQVLETAREFTEIRAFGIANDGTCVGRMLGEIDFETFSQPCDGFIWDTTLTTLNERFAEDPYTLSNPTNSFSYITANGTWAMGFGSTSDGSTSSFYVLIGNPNAGISDIVVDQPRVKGIYDLMGRKINTLGPDNHGIYIIDGKKVIR